MTVLSVTTSEAVPLRSAGGITLQNLGPGTLYVGGPGVTAATGFRVAPGEILSIERKYRVWLIAQTSSCDVRYLATTASTLDGVENLLAPYVSDPDSELGAAVRSAVSVMAADLSLVPDAAAWPITSYGASYATLGQAFFEAGAHWTQLLAEEAGAGTVTSYAVNGRRALDVALALLNGQAMNGITGIVAGAKWPGTSARPGLLVHDGLGNDTMFQAAMNAASVTVQAISGAGGTTYLNYLKQTYRAALALMSSEARIENHSHSATSGTWTHSSAGSWASGGDTCFTTEPGAYAEYSVTPPQSGPLAGKVWVIMAGDIPTTNQYATTAISVDGGAATNHTPQRVTYTGQNGTMVKGVVYAALVTLPVDGAAHTIRIAHAGTAGHFLIVDVLLVASVDPNPILCMGIELPPVASAVANGLDATDIQIYKGNLIQVTDAYKAIVAEFANAIYVPSTMTANGLWSGDGLHPNSRGQRQRKADAWAAVQRIKARLDSRALAVASDSEFTVV